MIHFNQNIQDLQKFNISVKDLLFLLNDIKTGQVLRGKVVELLEGNEFLMLINGQKILTQSKLNLKVGDILLLKVQSIKPAITLQFIGMEEESNQDVENGILRIFNLNQDKINQNVLSALIKNQMPINKQEFAGIVKEFHNLLIKITNIKNGTGSHPEIENLLNYINDFNITLNEENLINSLVFLKKNNLPINTSTILRTLIFQNQNQAIGEEINELLSLINKSDKDFKKYSERIQNILKEEFSISGAAEKIGLNYEKKILEMAKYSDKGMIEPDDSLKKVLLEIRDSIINNPKLENSEKLQQLSFRILNNIEMQQILNSDSSKNSRGLFFQVPVLMGNEFKTVEIKINKDSGKIKNYKTNGTSFSIKVEMSELGKVSSFGNLNNNSLSCNFNLEKQEYCYFFEKDINDLEKKMKEMGYKLNNIRIDSSNDIILNNYESDYSEKISTIDRII